MAAPDFPHQVETWLFDLDNTLYPAACDLFAQIDIRMGQFIAERLAMDETEARVLQKRYYRDHGTTLNGLMRFHDIDPADYLAYVHDIDLSPVPVLPELARLLDALPGRKLVYTNGSEQHARQVTAKLGVADRFEAIFDIAAADYRSKPDPDSYRRLVDRFDIDPNRAVMLDDIARNLAPAAALGMTTVWVRHHRSEVPDDVSHIDHVAEDLVRFLDDLPLPIDGE